MGLHIGTQLGSYEITALLGKGGMGEVYRARDPRLKRDVAVKILPNEFCRQPERVVRFQREAEVLASLNHPHIAGIYDLAEAGNERFLVMELVEGETLEERIARGRVSLEESLVIARQIAEALEAAHEKGIVHRDLKPANIKLANDRSVKVLDFGLAKFQQGSTDSAQLSNSPTLTSASVPGLILGTAAYMSPEQAKGKDADARSDVWGFGCVLYELLTGRPAFDGETLSEILGSVLKVEPDWNRVGPEIPAPVQRLLRRCLEKDPRRRLHHIGDARVELEDAIALPVSTTNALHGRRSHRKALFWVTGVVLATLVAATAIWWRVERVLPSEPRIFNVEVGEGLDAPRISPDGKMVVFVRNGRLAVRALDSLAIRDLEGTEGASNPAWSPDSQSIAYFAGQLRSVSVRGGASRVLTNAFAPFGAAWCAQGIIFSRWNQGLWLIPDGGREQQLAPLNTKAGESNLGHPHCLPDGRVMAVLRSNETLASTPDSARSSIVLISAASRRELLTLEDEILSPIFTAPNSVQFQRRGLNAGLWHMTVSENFSSIAGQPENLLANALHPSSSNNGILVVLSGISEGDRDLVWVDRTGRILSKFGRPQKNFLNPSITADGRRVIVATGSAAAGAEIWIHHEASIQRPRLNTVNNLHPSWSPAGDLIAYSGVDSGGTQGLFLAPAGRIGDVKLIVKNAYPTNSVWSRDGKYLVYQTGSGISFSAIDGEADSKPILDNASEPALSPDGRLLAYTSSVTGRREVYLTTFPTPGQIWPVSGDGGRYPRWNPRGGELFYATGPIVGSDPNSHRDLVVVKIDMKGQLAVGRPERVFDAPSSGVALNTRGFRAYEISPDGQRILTQTTGLKGIPTITLIENWKEWAARR